MPTIPFVVGSLLTLSVLGYVCGATFLAFKKVAEVSSSS